MENWEVFRFRGSMEGKKAEITLNIDLIAQSDTVAEGWGGVGVVRYGGGVLCRGCGLLVCGVGCRAARCGFGWMVAWMCGVGGLRCR